MTVRELRLLLKKFPQDARVAYNKFSEYKLLTADEIEVQKLQPARPDGWVHDDFKTTLLATETYVTFPGN